MGWSEEALHAWLLERPAAEVLVGSRGHDAAVLGELAGRPVLCVDQTIEGVHFEAHVDPFLVGRKAAGRALSDLAACAAKPNALLLSLSAPESSDEAWIRGVIDALDAAGRLHGAALVGGDLACAPGPRSLSVSALGCLPGANPAPGRDRAEPGDLMLLSGPMGGSSLGRHLRIEPRVDLGQWLFSHGARAMMDVSDGLARDLSRIARASGVRIDLEHVPLHADALALSQRSGQGARWHALYDGEDHELLASVSVKDWERMALLAAAEFPQLGVIGRVRSGEGLWFAPEKAGELCRWNGTGGWTHGA